MLKLKLMVPVALARLPDAAKFALAVALGCAFILQPMVDFVRGVSPRSPVLDAAVAVVLVALPLTYLAGVVLLYIHVAPPPPAAPPPGAYSATRFVAALACALASALLLAHAAFLFLVLVGAPPSNGLTPTTYLLYGEPCDPLRTRQSSSPDMARPGQSSSFNPNSGIDIAPDCTIPSCRVDPSHTVIHSELLAHVLVSIRAVAEYQQSARYILSEA